MSTATSTSRNTSIDLAQSSLVDRLLAIQNYQVVNEKSKAWAENLVCLEWRPNKTLQLKAGSCPESSNQDYIAVSYSWQETPGLEDGKAGGYSIVDCKGESLRPSRVRDQVLSRVIRYAKHHHISRFWIDQECIPTAEPEERQNAMDSMDLVYRNSAFPVGLLDVVLKTQDQVNSLQCLLLHEYDGRRKGASHPKLAHPVCAPSPLVVFHLLRHLQTDRWWTRAWIFQEEYLSSTSMHLLIRREQSTKALHDFGFLHGEMCVNAAEFREQATIFLLAFEEETRDRLHPLHRFHQKCAAMLERLGKYSIQYRFQRDAKRKAMAPRIFADILRREISKPYDQLPIAANSCDYAIRFDSEGMSKSDHEVDHCLLAMYLLNGEILRGARHIEKPLTEMKLSDYLQYISFDRFDPPVGDKHLTYLKSCRLHGVSLAREGILARGHLWSIVDTLTTCAWPALPPWSREPHGRGLDGFQRDCLYLAANKLRSRNRVLCDLADRIEEYLGQDLSDSQPSPAKQHMDLMAETVVEAIRTRRPLQIVAPWGCALASGLFTGVMDTATGIFTSWHADFDKDGRYRQAHVSLGVEVEGTKTAPLVTTVQWVNGLAFFRQRDQIPVAFKWPHKWTLSA